MDNYPSPCDKCPKGDRCSVYKSCKPWMTRYYYKQKQINAYAAKVLPAHYKWLEERGKQE